MNPKEMFSRDAVHINDLHKLMKFTCSLLEPHQLCHACEEVESNAKCSRFGVYFINVKNTYVCCI